jgi:hypothetical protein
VPRPNRRNQGANDSRGESQMPEPVCSGARNAYK